MTGVHGRSHHGRVDLDAFVRDGYVAIRGAVNAPGGFVLDGSDPSAVARAIVKGLAMAD
jgi:hypothetical protein